MRKFVLLMTAAFILLLSVNVSSADAGEAIAWLNTEKVNNGVVSVKYAVNAKVKTKLMIAKGTTNYTYNLSADKKDEGFALQLGNGEYTITLLENTTANKFKVVNQQKVTLNMKNNNDVYLNSVQNIAWTSNSEAILKAKELIKNKKTDTDKVKAIYDYIISNINYDNQLAAKVPTDYIPSIDRTFQSKKDICYGYASLFAAMLRSSGIPTKLLMGDSEYVDTYHAWNEVYLNGKWVTIDTTVDAGLKNSNKKTDLIKDASKYTVKKQY